MPIYLKIYNIGYVLVKIFYSLELNIKYIFPSNIHHSVLNCLIVLFFLLDSCKRNNHTYFVFPVGDVAFVELFEDENGKFKGSGYVI